MKVGDLVKYRFIPHPYAEEESNVGIIIELSMTGKTTLSAKVHFTNGEVAWHDTEILESMNNEKEI